MLRRFSGLESSGDHNWHRLWETPSKKSHRRYAKAWVHPIPSDLPFAKALVIPDHSIEPSKFIAMSSNPVNQHIEDQFLPGAKRWKRSKRSRPDRWPNYTNTRTTYSRRMNACELVWRLIGVKTREGLSILHPQLLQIRVKSPSSWEKVIPQ